jgi:hypothetical protein
VIENPAEAVATEVREEAGLEVRPVLVGRLAHEQYPVVAERHPTDAQLRRGVARSASEYHLDVPLHETGMLGHDLCGQSAEPLVTLAIVLIARRGKTGLCQCLYLACP